jgi:hypothetical protein
MLRRRGALGGRLVVGCRRTKGALIIGGASDGARARSVPGSAATIHPYHVMRDHPPVDHPAPMVAQLPRSARIIFGE